MRKELFVLMILVLPVVLWGQKDSDHSDYKHEITFGIPMLPSLFNNFGIQISREEIPYPNEGPLLWLSRTREGHSFFPPINFIFKKKMNTKNKLQICGMYYKVPTYYSFDKETTIPYLFFNAGIERKLNKKKEMDINLNYGLLFIYVDSQNYSTGKGYGTVYYDNLKSFFYGGEIGISIALLFNKELFIQSNMDFSVGAMYNKAKYNSSWKINALFPKLLGLNIGYKF